MNRGLEGLIRKCLQERQKTLTEFSRELGVTRVTVYNLFLGKYSRKLLERVSKCLSIPLHVLLSAKNGTATDDFKKRLALAYHAASPKVRSIVRALLNLEHEIPASDKKPVVIVVDDLQDNVDLLLRCFRKDFEVLEFTDPEAAFEAAKRTDVAAIVTDQRMPKMTGTRLLAKIQSLGRPVATMIVSAYSDNQALMEAINEAKVDAFIMKPFRPQAVHERLHSILATRPAQDPIVH
ncbi:MAG TPA: response regulator [Bdellovibrionota bacterium]|nr:response regulator [Bdellovibrionota bacterium]